MRKTAITILLMAAAVCAHAQTAYDGLIFSENNYAGTARSVAMGNAFTALGGDLGSVTINPAGSAVAGYSQFTITPGLTFSASTAQGVSPYADGTLPYFEREIRSNMTSFNIPNIGLTLNWNTNRTSGLKNITFGIVMNQSASWNQDVYANGTNSTTTFMGAMAVDATGFKASDLYTDNAYNYYPWASVVGYQSGMIGTFGGYDDEYVGASELVFNNGDIVIGGELDQTYGRRVKGGKYDYVFNLGANISDFLYLGANIGVSSLTYGYDDYFKETAIDPADFEIGLDNGETMYFQQMKFKYHYDTEATGVYAKFGAILTPGFGLRVGAAIQTPTVNTVREWWQYSGYTEFTSSKFNGSAVSPEGTFSYMVTSPYRANVGIAYTLGKFAVLSMDSEFCDYSQMRFRGENGSKDAFDDVNSDIKEFFGMSYTLRFGAELKLGALALRGGYGRTSSPEKHFEGPYRSNWSCGLGYSTKGSFYADFAIKSSRYSNEYYMPYRDYIFDDEGNIAEPAPEILITRSDLKAIMTLGWRF